MRTRNSKFEIVYLVDVASLRGRRVELRKSAKPLPKILSISYDESLAATREMIFTHAGFQVASAATIGEAIDLSETGQFDLIVVGHSLPLSHRKTLLEALRRSCDAPVLALYRQGEPLFAGVDHIFDSAESPALLLQTVKTILHGQKRKG